MIQIGDLVRTNWVMSPHRRKVLLVMQIKAMTGVALCTQGSQKIWINIAELEKL